MEVEHVALSISAKEASWLKMFIEELQLDQWINIPYKLFCHNRAVI